MSYFKGFKLALVDDYIIFFQPNPDQVDENGNWTVDNSRQRLNQFCQIHNIPCDVIYEEEGSPGSRVGLRNEICQVLSHFPMLYTWL